MSSIRDRSVSFDRLSEVIAAEEYNEDEPERGSLLLKRIIEEELTERQRNCIDLYFGKGMKIAQIAELLGLSKGTVSKHISKGKLKIGKMLSYSPGCYRFIH